MANSFFTRSEIAHILNVHPLTIRTWEKEGKIKVSFYVGKRPRYSIEDLEKVAYQETTLLNKENSSSNG